MPVVSLYIGGGGNSIEPDILNQNAILRYTGDNEEQLLNMISEIYFSSDVYMEFINRKPFRKDAAKIIWNKMKELEEHLIRLAR